MRTFWKLAAYPFLGALFAGLLMNEWGLLNPWFAAAVGGLVVVLTFQPHQTWGAVRIAWQQAKYVTPGVVGTLRLAVAICEGVALYVVGISMVLFGTLRTPSELFLIIPFSVSLQLISLVFFGVGVILYGVALIKVAASVCKGMDGYYGSLPWWVVRREALKKCGSMLRYAYRQLPPFLFDVAVFSAAVLRRFVVLIHNQLRWVVASAAMIGALVGHFAGPSTLMGALIAVPIAYTEWWLLRPVLVPWLERLDLTAV